MVDAAAMGVVVGTLRLDIPCRVESLKHDLLMSCFTDRMIAMSHEFFFTNFGCQHDVHGLPRQEALPDLL